MEQLQNPVSLVSRTRRSISKLLTPRRSPSPSHSKQHVYSDTSAASKGRSPETSSAMLPHTTGGHQEDAVVDGAATSSECWQGGDGDVMVRTPSDLNAGSFTRKQQQTTQQLHFSQQPVQSSRVSSRQHETVPAGRSSSQVATWHCSSSAITLESQQPRRLHTSRAHRSSRRKQNIQQQLQAQQQHVPLGQSLRDKWQARWHKCVASQAVARAAQAAAAAAEQQALLAAAAEEEEHDQLPTGASSAAARRSSYGEGGGASLQLSLQQLDPWVRDLAAWAQECPELIELQLLDIPVPEAYQLPDGHLEEKHPPASAAGAAAQPEDATAGACRKSAQLEHSSTTGAAADPDDGMGLQEQEQAKEQQENLKPLEKPVDFVAELAHAVAAVKELVEASVEVASCGFSACADDAQAVLKEGWRVVQEVDRELDGYEAYAKWVPKRAQNVSLQAVLQQLDVLQAERVCGRACEESL